MLSIETVEFVQFESQGTLSFTRLIMVSLSHSIYHPETKVLSSHCFHITKICDNL